jgi:hypothetical protein
MSTVLSDRGRSLTDEFFHQEDQKLIQRLRETKKFEEHKESLAKASGIKNESILKKLTELKIDPAALVALTMVPLVEVAWADGEVDEKERTAILTAAEQSGLTRDSPQHALLEQWIQKRSDPRLMKAWLLYVSGLCEELSSAQINALRSEVLGLARTVAEASGGILGLGMKTSKKETQILQKLEAAFKK